MELLPILIFKNNLNNIVVEFELTDPNVFKLKKGSLVLLNSDLLSGSYLDISYGDSLDYYNSRDTIPSSVSLALEDQINERLIPLEKKTNELISTADSAIKTIEAIFSRNIDNLDESFDGIKTLSKFGEGISSDQKFDKKRKIILPRLLLILKPSHLILGK